MKRLLSMAVACGALLCAQVLVAHCGKCVEDTCEYCAMLLSGDYQKTHIVKVPYCTCVKGKCKCADPRHEPCICFLEHCDCAPHDESVTNDGIVETVIIGDPVEEDSSDVTNQIVASKPISTEIVSSEPLTQDERVMIETYAGAKQGEATLQDKLRPPLVDPKRTQKEIVAPAVSKPLKEAKEKKLSGKQGQETIELIIGEVQTIKLPIDDKIKGRWVIAGRKTPHWLKAKIDSEKQTLSIKATKVRRARLLLHNKDEKSRKPYSIKIGRAHV